MELLPCPFCGGEAEVNENSFIWVAQCQTCGGSTGLLDTEAEAIDALWNGVRVVQIEDVGLQGVPYDENFIVCDECMGKAYDLLLKIKAVER